VWHSEGLSGWWVASATSLTTDELAFALKAKYGASVKLDLAQYEDDPALYRKSFYYYMPEEL
jgi:hypothetical protein